MYAHRRTVVARAREAAGQRRVALIAERLPGIGLIFTSRAPSRMAGSDSRSTEKCLCSRRSNRLTEGRKSSCFADDLASGVPDSVRRAWGSVLALAMHLVAAQARNRGLVRQFGPQQTPRTFGIHRRHQFPYAAFEMHAVAAQAIVVQQTLPVVPWIHEQAP